MIDYGFIHRYPTTNFHELNLDWLLSQMIELRSDMRNFVNQNTIKYADPIQWNITTQYEGNTVVVDNQGNAYLSTQPVPAGVNINNTDYWSIIGNFSLLFDSIKESITVSDEGSSTVASENRNAGDWVWLNDVLYIITSDITTGESYVEGVNCEKESLENLFSLFKSELSQEVNQVSDIIDSLYFDTVSDMILHEDWEGCDHVVTGGYYSVNDGGNSLYKIRKITDDDIISENVDGTTSNMGLIRLIDDYCAELLPEKSIDFRQFGVVNTDSSDILQNLFDYVASKNIIHITSSINTTLHDVEIKSDVDIDFMGHKLQGVRYTNTANTCLKMFINTSPLHFITIKNVEVNGFTDISTASGDKLIYGGLFHFNNVNNVIFDNVIFDKVDQAYRQAQTFETMGQMISTTDCYNTIIRNCRYLYAHAEGLNGIWAYTKNREEVNLTFENNILSENVNTSALDFNGNNCLIKNNTYNFDFAGSLVNCFGLNVKISGDVINGTVQGCYDTCEETYYRGHSVEISNVIMNKIADSYLLQCANEHVYIHDMRVRCGIACVIARPGYRSSNPMPHGNTSGMERIAMLLENLWLGGDTKIIYSPLMNASGSALIKLSNSYVNGTPKSIIAKGFDVILEHCNLTNTLDSDYSGSVGIFCYFQAAYTPKSVRLINCDIHNRSVGTAEPVFSTSDSDVLIFAFGNSSNASAQNDTLMTTGSTYKSLKATANYGFA